MANHTKLSKFMSMVLRHRAQEFGIELDKEGFTDVGALYEVVQKRYNNAYSYDDLIRVATTPGSDLKMRFELRGMRIRARYGHNKRVQAVSYEPVEPPELLYHGTATDALDSIRKDGLQPRQRQYVHMATTTERALSVGARHGTPILLQVRALEAYHDGIVFYHPEDEHYLADHIPAKYLLIPEA